MRLEFPSGDCLSSRQQKNESLKLSIMTVLFQNVKKGPTIDLFQWVQGSNPRTEELIPSSKGAPLRKLSSDTCATTDSGLFEAKIHLFHLRFNYYTVQWFLRKKLLYNHWSVNGTVISLVHARKSFFFIVAMIGNLLCDSFIQHTFHSSAAILAL